MPQHSVVEALGEFLPVFPDLAVVEALGEFFPFFPALAGFPAKCWYKHNAMNYKYAT